MVQGKILVSNYLNVDHWKVNNLKYQGLKSIKYFRLHDWSKRVMRLTMVLLKLWNIRALDIPKFSKLRETYFTFYPLVQTADFPKLANKDTLPEYNIPSESH